VDRGSGSKRDRLHVIPLGEPHAVAGGVADDQHRAHAVSPVEFAGHTQQRQLRAAWLELSENTYHTHPSAHRPGIGRLLGPDSSP